MISLLLYNLYILDNSFHNLSRQSKNMNDDTLNLTTKKNLENG